MKKYFYHHNKIRLTLESYNLVREIKKRLLFNINKLLVNLNIKYTIACGNLIEYERGSPIYHDDDIDIRVDFRDWEKWVSYLSNINGSDIENNLTFKRVQQDKNGLWYHVFLLKYDNINLIKGLNVGIDLVISTECAGGFWKKYDINFDDLRSISYLDINTFAPNINDTKKVLQMDYGPNYIIPNYAPYTIISSRLPQIINNLKIGTPDF